MVRFRHVLHPTDLSPTSGLALRHAVAIARAHGAELTLFHVLVPYEGESEDLADRFPDDRMLGEILRDMEGAARGRIDRDIAAALEAGEVRVGRVVVRGPSPSDRILEYARSRPADLVVMGTHGRRGFNRFLLGSEAERVLRFAPCPVLTVSNRSAGIDPTHALRRIVVPHDFSPPSERALGIGIGLAARHQAAVDVVHVLDEPVVPPFLMDHAASYLRMNPQGRERCRQALEKAVAAQARRGVATETHLVEGRIAPSIQEFASKRGADLVVMGTRGLAGLDHILLGSCAAHVVRLASCPVLTVHTVESPQGD